ncbi:cyclin 10, putative, partial [Bodo saltans]
ALTHSHHAAFITTTSPSPNTLLQSSKQIVMATTAAFHSAANTAANTTGDITSSTSGSSSRSSGVGQRPLVLDFLSAQALPLLATAGGSATSLAAPPLGQLADLSPRRRFVHGDTSTTPLSPYAPTGQPQVVDTNQTPLPTPPTGQPLTMPSTTNTPTSGYQTSGSSPTAGRTLFFLSPAEVEPARHSHRSGRLLGELESLHQKHESEFRVLVPAIGNALKSTLDAHEAIQGMMPSSSSSPADRATMSSSNGAADERGGAPSIVTGDSWRSLECDGCMAHYDTVAPPSLSIQAYVKRVSDFTYVSPATLLSTVILVDRLLERYPLLYLSPTNIYKIFFVAARIASKVLDLRSLNNKNFASVGGVSNQHLNDLEAKMLMDLRFDLFISQEHFVRYARCVIPANMVPPQQHNTVGGSSGNALPVGALFNNPVMTGMTGHHTKGQPTNGATSPRRTTFTHQVTFAVPPALSSSKRPSQELQEGGGESGSVGVAVEPQQLQAASGRMPHPPTSTSSRVDDC